MSVEYHQSACSDSAFFTWLATYRHQIWKEHIWFTALKTSVMLILNSKFL